MIKPKTVDDPCFACFIGCLIAAVGCFGLALYLYAEPRTGVWYVLAAVVLALIFSESTRTLYYDLKGEG